MEWIDQGNPSQWIEEATRDQPFGKISRLIPVGYEAYCRILHPIFEDPSIEDRRVTWHQAGSNVPLPEWLDSRLSAFEVSTMSSRR